VKERIFAPVESNIIPHVLLLQVAPAWRTKSDKLKDFGYFDPLYIT
jgi:hypothetical protein